MAGKRSGAFRVLTWLLVSGTAVSFFWSELFLAVLIYPEGLRLLSRYADISGDWRGYCAKRFHTCLTGTVLLWDNYTYTE
jgi:hypothetical protein